MGGGVGKLWQGQERRGFVVITPSSASLERRAMRRPRFTGGCGWRSPRPDLSMGRCTPEQEIRDSPHLAAKATPAAPPKSDRQDPATCALIRMNCF